jgi:hypothetical protein
VRAAKALIVLKTMLAAAAYALATFAVHRLLLDFRPWASPEFALALALTLVQGGLVLGLAVTLAIIRVFDQAQDRKFRAVSPRIRAVLADCSFGRAPTEMVKDLAAEYPEEFDKVFDEVISIVRGEARRRLGRAAEDSGLVQRWVGVSTSGNTDKRARAMAALGVVGNAAAIEVLLRALHDPADVVRLEAGLALVRVGGEDETEQVFEFALSQNGLIRFLIMEALRWRAQFLCNGPLRRYLRSGDAAQILACLETVEAWRVALDLPEMPALLKHPSPAVRERGYRILPYLTSAEEYRGAILSGMSDSEERVRTAAVFAAGRLKLATALPLLESRLNEGDGRLALTAAYSLAEIGPDGVGVLERAVMSGRPSGAAALEALERLRTGRFEHANL